MQKPNEPKREPVIDSIKLRRLQRWIGEKMCIAAARGRRIRQTCK